MFKSKELTKQQMIYKVLIAGVALQFLLVISLIAADGYFMYLNNGDPHDMITGAIVGLTTGLSTSSVVAFLINQDDPEPKELDKKEAVINLKLPSGTNADEIANTIRQQLNHNALKNKSEND